MTFLISPGVYPSTIDEFSTISPYKLFLKESEASIYGMSSFRHFLPEVARIRGVSSLEARELGAWSGFMDAPLGSDPRANLLAAGEAAAAAMPDSYSPQSAECLKRKVFSQQVDACKEVVRRVGLANLPRAGGWNLFS